MRICIAIEKFNPQVGGAERYCWDLAHFLAGRGHDVKIVCMSAQDTSHDSIHIIRLTCIRFPQALRHLSFALLHRRMARSLSDHIHFCVGNTCFMDVYQPHGGVHAAWFDRDSLRYDSHMLTASRFFRRMSLKDMIQRSLEWWTFRVQRPRVIAISDMVAQDIRDRFEYPSSLITLIPNGIDTRRFTEHNSIYRSEIRDRYGLSEDDFVFLFVAQNFTLKGFDVLLEAAHKLGRGSCRILLIGPADAAVRRKAALYGNSLVIGGRASDMEKIYPACDCLVHPTFYDACSLVVLESLACGLPVITTSVNGASMYLNERTGIVIPPGDSERLEEAMLAMMGRKRTSAEMTFKNHDEVFSDVEDVLIQEEVRRSTGKGGQ
ncbi:MAG TPA: glycosyltransferase family 1 protein [Deltaproteobacteria bacterium]|nr:glycosyltransferase family 1 protein [Deltaproteobacteria bacterium]